MIFNPIRLFVPPKLIQYEPSSHSQGHSSEAMHKPNIQLNSQIPILHKKCLASRDVSIYHDMKQRVSNNLPPPKFPIGSKQQPKYHDVAFAADTMTEHLVCFEILTVHLQDNIHIFLKHRFP